MSGGKRNPDKINTIGIVVVGVCGAVLVYVSIVALQAFYVNDTSDIQTMADYGGQDMPMKNLRAQQMGSINEFAPNPAPQAPKAGEPAKQQTYKMPIDRAMEKVTEGAKADPSNLVPAVGRSDHPTVVPIFKHGLPVAPPAAPTDGAGSGSAAGSGAGSGSDTAAPMVPTGAAEPPGANGAPGQGSAAKGNGP